MAAATSYFAWDQSGLTWSLLALFQSDVYSSLSDRMNQWRAGLCSSPRQKLAPSFQPCQVVLQPPLRNCGGHDGIWLESRSLSWLLRLEISESHKARRYLDRPGQLPRRPLCMPAGINEKANDAAAGVVEHVADFSSKFRFVSAKLMETGVVGVGTGQKPPARPSQRRAEAKGTKADDASFDIISSHQKPGRMVPSTLRGTEEAQAAQAAWLRRQDFVKKCAVLVRYLVGPRCAGEGCEWHSECAYRGGEDPGTCIWLHASALLDCTVPVNSLCCARTEQ